MKRMSCKSLHKNVVITTVISEKQKDTYAGGNQDYTLNIKHDSEMLSMRQVSMIKSFKFQFPKDTFCKHLSGKIVFLGTPSRANTSDPWPKQPRTACL